MITVKIINKEDGMASVYSGRFALCFVNQENCLAVTLMGDTNALEMAEYAGEGLRDVFKSMSEKEGHSEALDMAVKSVFLKHFFSDKNAPGKQDA